MKLLCLLAAALCAALSAPAQAQVTSVARWQLTSPEGAALSLHATQSACDVAARARGVTATYPCPRVLIVTAPPPACTTPQPAAQSRAQACPAGTTGAWTQTNAYVAAPAPACWASSAWLPASAPSGACAAIPPPPPPPPPAGTAMYFSDCQPGAAAGCVAGSNANPGTLAAPKQTTAGLNLDTLAAGTSLLFARGGAWNLTAMLRLENLNATAAAPLAFADYGTGPLPLFRFTSGQSAVELGGGWNNQSDDGGYVFRNIKFDGGGVTTWGFWLRDNVKDVTFDGVELTGFQIAIHSQTLAPFGVNNINLLNSRVVRNSDMGWLGKVKSGLRIEGSYFEGNNFSGSGFSHAVYNGGGDNLIVRNNRFVRNSVGPSGTCGSGSLTLHGQITGALIEGNTFEQDASSVGCWQVSITQGYSTAEWFRNLVVRGNRIINGGNAGMVIHSAPGALVENNVVINTQATPQTAIVVGNSEYLGGDVIDENAVVRNNTACYPAGLGSVARVSGAGAQVTDNVLLVGAAATAGVCAR